MPHGVPVPARNQTASVLQIGPPTGHVLFSFALISLEQGSKPWHCSPSHLPSLAGEPGGPAMSRVEVASTSTVSCNADDQSLLTWRTLPGTCNFVLVTQPVCQPPASASILPTEVMGILRLDRPLILFLPVQLSFHKRRRRDMPLLWAQPRGRPSQRKVLVAGHPQQYVVSSQGTSMVWGFHVLPVILHSPTCRSSCPFLRGVSATCQRAAFWWRCSALSSFVAFFNAKQHAFGLKAYHCIVWRKEPGKYNRRRRRREQTQGEKPRNHAATCRMLTNLLVSLIRKKPSSENFVGDGSGSIRR